MQKKKSLFNDSSQAQFLQNLINYRTNFLISLKLKGGKKSIAFGGCFDQEASV